ncbi:hypothetical protein [Paraburkholderia xenovorans]
MTEMTMFAVETALYDLGVKRVARTAFSDDADSFLSRYRLTEAELHMIKTFDVCQMQAIGVSALLTLGFWMTNEPTRSRAGYLDRLNHRKPMEGV